jgi:hypothetical protein
MKTSQHDTTPLCDASLAQLIHALMPAYEPMHSRLSKAEFQIKLALKAANEGSLEQVKTILAD